MTKVIDHELPSPTVQTRVWLDEHEWLGSLYKSRRNSSPRFRMGDLLSACVSLALVTDAVEQSLVEYLVNGLTRRDPQSERRSCDLWAAQYDLLLVAHRASWNRSPNPMFEIDQLTTGCVALVMRRSDSEAAVLRQARANLRARAVRPASPLN